MYFYKDVFTIDVSKQENACPIRRRFVRFGLRRTAARHRGVGKSKADSVSLVYSTCWHHHSGARQSTFQQSRDSGWHRHAGVHASWPLREWDLVPPRYIACSAPIVPTALLFY